MRRRRFLSCLASQFENILTGEYHPRHHIKLFLRWPSRGWAAWAGGARKCLGCLTDLTAWGHTGGSSSLGKLPATSNPAGYQHLERLGSALCVTGAALTWKVRKLERCRTRLDALQA